MSEKEIFEFLDSLPTDDSNNSASTSSTTDDNREKTSKSDDTEILEFLDELEESNKKKEMPKEEPKKKVKEELKKEVEEEPKEEPKEELKEEVKEVAEKPVQNDEPVNDPITSIASWWSNSGSTQVSNQLSSLWGTAQSITDKAQKQAEDALKLAREQSMDTNIKNVFKEIGISGIHENLNDLLSDEQLEELSKLNIKEAEKVIKNLNTGLNNGLKFFNGTLNEVIEKINLLNSKDEIIEVYLAHDMKNYIGLSNTVKSNFENVMNQQVDGLIDIQVVESGTIKADATLQTERINFSLFNGKGSDAEKLIMANLENEMKQRAEDKDDGVKKTKLFIGLLAWTSNKDDSDVVGSGSDGNEIIIDSNANSSFTISCILKDKEHDILINAKSQPLPLKWLNWIEHGAGDAEEDMDDIDPSDWVIEWINNTVNNVIGITSQSYVIKRMGY